MSSIWLANAALTVVGAFAAFHIFQNVNAADTVTIAGAPPQTAAASADLASLKGFVRPPLTDFKETIARPVFSPTRRPADAPMNGVPVEAAVESTHFVLLGVALDDLQKSALIKATADGKTQRVRIGETVNGWNVTAITDDHVTVTANGTSARIALRSKQKGEIGTIATRPAKTAKPVTQAFAPRQRPRVANGEDVLSEVDQ